MQEAPCRLGTLSPAAPFSAFHTPNLPCPEDVEPLGPQKGGRRWDPPLSG